MSNQLPTYIEAARPVPLSQRQPWYKNTAPTYAGIMLWFVFWQDVASGGGNLANGVATLPGGVLSQGLGVAFLGLVVAALICHFLFYLVPGLLGMKSGFPLYIVGSSTYGARGGFLMPGFLMGVLQFGWLGVNAFFSAFLIYGFFAEYPAEFPTAGHALIAAVWAVLAAVVGLKGIQYVAKVATFLPLIPFTILLLLLFNSLGGIAAFDQQVIQGMIDSVRANNQAMIQEAAGRGETLILPSNPLGLFGILALISAYVVGFFATAGAAGADFGMNNPDSRNVQWGGLVGIFGATVVAGGASLLIVAGAFGSGLAGDALTFRAASEVLMGRVMGSDGAGRLMLLLLALASFPPACFSSFIAANSFRTTLPRINPFLSVGVGTAVSVILAVTGLAGRSIVVFEIIGASFGPICGAMLVDYLLAGRKWPGPRAGFNPAGWISWAVGFLVGIGPRFGLAVPAAPVAAFLAGALVYFVAARLGWLSQSLPLARPAKAPSSAVAAARK